MVCQFSVRTAAALFAVLCDDPAVVLVPDQHPANDGTLPRRVEQDAPCPNGEMHKQAQRQPAAGRPVRGARRHARTHAPHSVRAYRHRVWHTPVLLYLSFNLWARRRARFYLRAVLARTAMLSQHTTRHPHQACLPHVCTCARARRAQLLINNHLLYFGPPRRRHLRLLSHTCIDRATVSVPRRSRRTEARSTCHSRGRCTPHRMCTRNTV